MYVVPRPVLQDDPLFAIRLALISISALIAIQLLEPAMPPLVAVLPVALAATMRKAFNLRRTLSDAAAVVVLSYVFTFIIAATRPMPSLMILIMLVIFFGGFYLIRRTGNPAGLVVLAVATLLSIMGMKQPALIYAVRDTFVQSALVVVLAIPLAYLLLPAASTERHMNDTRAAPGQHAIDAAVRAAVLMILCLWLYAVLPASDMLLAVAAIFPLVLPTRGAAWVEAHERTLATVWGALAALLILLVIGQNGHFLIVAGLMGLAALVFGSGMIGGPRPSTVYQSALMTTGALVIGALSTQSPGYAAFTRIVLTMLGTLGAVLLVSLIERVILRNSAAVPEGTTDESG